MSLALHGLLSSVAASAGLVFNGYILFVLLWRRRIQTSNNLLLLHLAFVDSVFCLVVLVGNAAWGLTIAHSLEIMDQIPRGSCEVHGTALTVLPAVVMWTVCGLSCDRYAAISTPLHYSRLVNTRRAGAFLGFVWLLGSALALPPLFDVCPYQFCKTSLACVADCSRAAQLDVGYAITYVALALILPLFVVFVCNLRILNIARGHRHRIASAIYQVTLSAQATVTRQSNPFYPAKFLGRSAILTIAQLIGSLVALAAPYFCIVVWEAASGDHAPPLFVTVASIMFTWTPPVNAYMYGVKSKVLRQTFKSLLRRHLSKREAIRAVESRASLSATNTLKRTTSRRGSAPGGFFDWGIPRSRGSPFTGSLRLRDRSPDHKNKAFHRRPSFMVELGGFPASTEFLHEIEGIFYSFFDIHFSIKKR